MSAWKSALIGVAIAGGLVGVALTTGIASIEQTDAIPDAYDKGEKPVDAAKEAVEDLEALAYVGVEMSAEDAKKMGLTRRVADKDHDGLTLFNPTGTGAFGAENRVAYRHAVIMDNEGNELHRFSSDELTAKRGGWAIARLSNDGHLYAVVADAGLLKLDWDSNLVWKLEGVYHHDFNFDADGNILVLSEQRRVVEHEGHRMKIIDQGVQRVTPDGVVQRWIWFYDQFKEVPEFKAHMKRMVQRRERKRARKKKGRLAAADVFHANAVEAVAAPVEGLWDKGDLLVSFRMWDSIAVIDDETGEPKWNWGFGELDRQHDPTQLENGNILVFDNGFKRKWSRVAEVDPREGKIVWSYRGKDEDKFFSKGRGVLQPLPNGSIFIASSNSGRMFEVTREGEVLWEYYCKLVHEGKRVPVRGVRLEGEALEATLAKLKAAGKTIDLGADAAEPEPEPESKPTSKDGEAKAEQKP